MKQLTTKNKIMNNIEKAKAELKEAGFYVDNLIHIQEVKKRFECSDEMAYEFLRRVMNSLHYQDVLSDLIDIEIEYLRGIQLI